MTEEFVMVPVNSIVPKYVLEHVKDKEWDKHLHDDIKENGLHRALEVTEEKDKRGKKVWGLIGGNSRLEQVKKLHKEHASLLFTPKIISPRPIPKGKIPCTINRCDDLAALLLAAKDNFSRSGDERTKKQEYGAHFTKIIDSRVKQGNSIESCMKWISEWTHREKTWIYECLKEHENISPKLRQAVKEGKYGHLSSKHLTRITAVNDHKVQEAIAKRADEEGWSVEVLDRVVRAAQEKLPLLQTIETSDKKNMAKRVLDEATSSLDLMNLMKLPPIEEYAEIVVHAVTCPDCGSRITYVPCRKCTAKLYGTAASEAQDVSKDVALPKCRASVSLVVKRPTEFKERMLGYLQKQAQKHEQAEKHIEASATMAK